MSLRCHFDADGWLRGPVSITHLMTPNHGTGFGTGRGAVMHTEDGFEAGTVATFMNPASKVSAFFSAARDGSGHQYLPVGKGLVAWTQAAGNEAWRGIEDEDRTHPSIPLTIPQMTFFAQVTEACSAFDGFPLEVTDDPVNGRGLILHSDGGQAWGGHLQCPGPVRAAQRPAIITLARQIRAGFPPVPAPPARTWTAEGMLPLAVLCSQHLRQPAATVLAKTCGNSPGNMFAASLARHVDAVFAGDAEHCPAGIIWYYPGSRGVGQWTAEGMLPLAVLATQIGSTPAGVLQVTAGRSPGGQFTGAAAAYINAVFGRSSVKVPAGVKLYY